MGHSCLPVKRWQLHFLGLAQIPADITEFEIVRFFSIGVAERRAIMTRRSARHRLAVAVHLGFMRMTGRALDALEILPAPLLSYLEEQLSLPVPDIASLRALYRRGRTLFEHQNLAAETLGFQSFSRARRRILVTQVDREAQIIPSTDELVMYARQWLYRNRILIPAERTLRALAHKSQAKVESVAVENICATIPEDVRDGWYDQVFVPHPSCDTILEWLQQYPGRRSLPALVETLEKVLFLKNLGVDQYKLDTIHLCRQRAYAQRLRHRRPYRVAQLKPTRRTLELACFLRVTLLELTDVVLSLADMHGSKIERTAKDKVEESDRRLVEPLLECIHSIRSAAIDGELSAEQRLERVLALLPANMKPASKAARLRLHLRADARRTRPFMRQMTKLDFQEAGDAPITTALGTLRELYKEDKHKLPQQISADFAPRWASIINDSDRKSALRGYEAAVMQELQRGLRSGSIWTEDSFEHRSREEIFISSSDWEKSCERHYQRLGLPSQAQRHIDPLLAALKVSLEGLAQAVRSGVVTIEDGSLHYKALPKESEPKDLEAVRTALLRAVGSIQLPELMMEMDQATGFSCALLGRPARSEKELLATYGALLIHGTELDATAVALMIPELSAAEITMAMHSLESASALRRANESALAFMREHPIVEMWGEGTMLSSDAMSLEATRHLWNARVDPKHRRYAMGMYTHVLDQWGILYDQPIVLGYRQAGAAIEGMIRQSTTAQPTILAVDTHGYTNFAMAIAKLLGFDLCPRLRDFKDRKLYVPRGTHVPKELEDVVAFVSLDPVCAGWDGLVRVAASIQMGHTSAPLALNRFGSAARGDPTHSAGSTLGKINRTLYLCDYYTNPLFRRELLRVLNYGETVHTLQRAIYQGNISPNRGRRYEELVAISGSLSLLSNLVMAWTTHRMQEAIDRDPKTLGRPELLRHVGAVQFRGVNLRGQMHFPMQRYKDRLISKGRGSDDVSRPKSR